MQERNTSTTWAMTSEATSSTGTTGEIGTTSITGWLDEADEPTIQRVGGSHHSGYLREFVAWDGEGITYMPGEPQAYVLFGNSKGLYVRGRDLSTESCLDLLLRSKQVYPESIFVGFALGYDFNMLLKDLSERHLWTLYRKGIVKWNGYIIERVPGKWLKVRRLGYTGAKLYDVFGFFQSSFVTACEKFLGRDDPELDRIRAGKLARSNFRYEEMDEDIIPYWEGELRLLVRLMDALRDDLHSAGLRIRSWHGPGAVANTVFRQFNVINAKASTPEEVNRAAQYAYAGGRFELFRCGHHPSTVWEYDINSAYPSAIAGLPNLQTGRWEMVDDFDPCSFGVWRVRYDYEGDFGSTLLRPHPFFVRGRHGEVSFPPAAYGWYWTPEASLSPDSVRGGWVYREDSGDEPFRFIHEMYDQRLKWKQEGNSAERALKLALNSLYGKMAQRVGSVEGKPPQWHQLEWAGYVTSHARAKLFRVLSMNSDAVIAVETDAIFSTRPLIVEVGTGLGQWEKSVFDWITYIQSGLYYAGDKGETLERYRGFDRGSLPHSLVLDYLRQRDSAFEPWQVPPPTGLTTRFIGMGLGLRTSAVWRAWETEPRKVILGGGGKRAHRDTICPECQQHKGISSTLHTMTLTSAGGYSYPHTLPWIDENSGNDIRLLEDTYQERY